MSHVTIINCESCGHEWAQPLESNNKLCGVCQCFNGEPAPTILEEAEEIFALADMLPNYSYLVQK